MSLSGVKGHGDKCECDLCIKAKLLQFKEKIREMVRVRPPPTPDSTVPVRAHWRRQPNHLNKQPKLRTIIQGIVRKMQA